MKTKAFPTGRFHRFWSWVCCWSILFSTGLAATNGAECDSAVPDQSQGVAGTWISLRLGGNQRFVYAQTFTPQVTGYLCGVMISAVWSDVFPESPTSFTIVDTIGELPGTNVLGRAAVPHLLNDPQIVEPWAPRVFLRAGVRYAMILETDAPQSSFRCYSFRASPGNSYGPGAVWERTPTNTWMAAIYFGAPNPDLDIVFTTYMLAFDPVVRLAAPADGALLRVNEPVFISADVRPGIIGPMLVSFYRDQELLGTDDAPPFGATWTPQSPGASGLVAQLNYGGSLSATSEVVHVTVNTDGPPNDDYAQRIRIADNYSTRSFNNVGATLETLEPRAEPSSAGKTVWWDWQPNRSAPVTVQVGGEQQTNAVVAVYTGSQMQTLVLVTNRVVGCAFAATTNNLYTIVVDSLTGELTNGQLWLAQSDVEIAWPTNGAAFKAPANLLVATTRTETNREITSAMLWSGTNLLATRTDPPLEFDVTLAEPGPRALWITAADSNGVITRSRDVSLVVRPANDNFEDATPVSGYRVAGHASNLSATLQGTRLTPFTPRTGEPTWADNQGGHSIWYRWTAPEDGLCTISGQGDGFGLLLGAYLGASVSNLSFVAINAMAYPAFPITFQAAAGTTYNISLDGYLGEEGPLDWSLVFRPVNDDFANRTQISGAQSQAIASHRGATLEAGESALALSTNVVSVWWSWTSPVSGTTVVSAMSETARTRVCVFAGSVLTNLQLVASSGTTLTSNAVASLHAEAGTSYQIAVFGLPEEVADFTFALAMQTVRLTNPLDGSTHRAPANLELRVQMDGALSPPARVEYHANDSLVANVSESPWSFRWEGVEAGTYSLQARLVSADGVTNTSPLVAILVYNNDDLPSPRIFAGTYSRCSYVINAVGSFYVLGNAGSQFGLDPEGDPFRPRLAKWTSGVKRWVAIKEGWGLTDTGYLYQNGTTLVPFPLGVQRWSTLGAGAWHVADDGNIYGGGVTPVSFTPGGIEWEEAGAGYQYNVALARDGRAFLEGWPAPRELALPSGVGRWTKLEVGQHTPVLKGGDGNLYQAGNLGGLSDRIPTLVAKPAGVTNWPAFSVGGFHVLAIGSDGQLYSWGRNWEGQLGLGSSGNDRTSPSKVPLPAGVTAWTSVAAGEMHSLAIGGDGSLYAWGANDNGQLGIGPLPGQPLPIRVNNVGALWGIPIIFTGGNTTRLEDGSFRLEFRSDLNRRYLIQYSGDLADWKNAVPDLLGNGDLIQWVDDGPPKTESHPRTISVRTYRVVFAQ